MVLREEGMWKPKDNGALQRLQVMIIWNLVGQGMNGIKTCLWNLIYGCPGGCHLKDIKGYMLNLMVRSLFKTS